MQLAQREMTLGELLARPAQTFTRLGGVMSLDVVVRPMPPRSPAEYRIVVPATVRFEDLAVFRANQAGWVLLFVNDVVVGNNSGGFEVRVVVTPPR